MRYNLVITPGIEVDERHQIEDVLESRGYTVTGGGTGLDEEGGMVSSDISFEKGGDKMPLDLDSIYTYHAPKDNQPKKYETIRAQAKVLAEVIEDLCPDSRERSVAFTQLETAVMWANASIARNE